MNLLDLLQAPTLDEDFERLRCDLSSRHIAVVGAQGGEGTSTVAARLACARAGHGRTLLAEGNLRRPCFARELGLQALGLLDWTPGHTLPVQPLGHCPGLAVLTAGDTANSVEPSRWPSLLAAAAARARLDYDITVWDTPALASHADLLSIVPHCDGVLVVVEMDRTRIDRLQFLREALHRANAPVLGVVLNRSGRHWPLGRRAS